MTKQSFHQKLNRQLLFLQEMEQLLVLARQIRVDHPRMSARQMYRLIRPAQIGRDRFEAFCFENGFKVSIKRAYHRTTNSLGVTRFTNLLAGLELTGINQVWVSDITYYRIGEKFYYLTFFLDLYSRVIVGHSVASDLFTQSTTIVALQMAVKGRRTQPGLILHSDGGGQYYCKEWLHLTAHHQFRNSMAESVYENPNAERINGIIKNDYLVGYGPENCDQLIRMTAKAVRKYNEEKPHGSLGNVSPYQYERSLN
ncbi:MAG TPA: DDE-type integrase/transposase/recombinase [Chryseosolibacter sp.]|nr:DDE-type integrase/transposase/recombinase [Chryseosolibacter sp.]